MRYTKRPIRGDVAVFEATLDDAVKCNPRAIFLAMRDSETFAGTRLVWAIADPLTAAHYRSVYRGYRNVRIVRRGSRRHLRYLATARYVITNGSLTSSFWRRDGQTVVNTWHGVPLKRMGFEIPGGRADARNVLRVFLQCDYLLSGSPYETEALYTRSHMLDGLFAGKVLEEGHPRVDLVLNTNASDERQRLVNMGIPIAIR